MTCLKASDAPDRAAEVARLLEEYGDARVSIHIEGGAPSDYFDDRDNATRAILAIVRELEQEWEGRGRSYNEALDTIATLRAQLASAEAERDVARARLVMERAIAKVASAKRDTAEAALATAQQQLGAVREYADRLDDDADCLWVPPYDWEDLALAQKVAGVTMRKTAIQLRALTAPADKDTSRDE